MKICIGFAIIVLVFIGSINQTQAQGTAFTYQGQLIDSNAPANGLYDIRTGLYATNTGGSLVTSLYTNTAVPVSNGLFIITMDFGDVFNGTSYWLQIGVRTNGAASFMPLNPRQELTPTPYAVTSENLDGTLPASQLTGTLPAGLLSGTYGGALTLNNAGDVFGGDGSGLTGLNASQLTTGTVPDARLSANVALLNASQTFTGINSFSGNINLLDPTKSITFPATSGANAPMMQMFASGTVNADRMVIAHSPFYPTWGLQYQDTPDRFNFLSAGTPVLSINLGYPNCVGIGTTNPTGSMLEVNGDARIDGNRILLDSGTGTNDGLGFGDSGLPGINSGGGPFLFGFLGGALGAISPNTVCLSWDYSGNVWVNQNLSTESLTVRGEYLVVDGLTPVQAYIGDDGSGNDVQIGSQKSGITAVACYNTADNAYMHLYCSSITIEGGADLAEPFEISSRSAEIPQGSVVVIDEENPGHLKVSSQAYDSRVAGVLSGANGINPGIQMQQQGLLDGGKNVALTGRVYVLADASGGAIKPGDLLTTSDTPGHAMKASDHTKAQGAILGKAMTGLKGGKGVVLVLVALQ